MIGARALPSIMSSNRIPAPLQLRPILFFLIFIRHCFCFDFVSFFFFLLWFGSTLRTDRDIKFVCNRLAVFIQNSFFSFLLLLSRRNYYLHTEFIWLCYSHTLKLLFGCGHKINKIFARVDACRCTAMCADPFQTTSYVHIFTNKKKRIILVFTDFGFSLWMFKRSGIRNSLSSNKSHLTTIKRRWKCSLIKSRVSSRACVHLSTKIYFQKSRRNLKFILFFRRPEIELWFIDASKYSI